MIQFFCTRFDRRADGSHDESGIAMIIAITVVLLMTIIPLAIVQGAIGQLPLSRHDQDHESALSAAEAGVDDYLNRLAQNSNYWTYSAAVPPPATNSAFTAWAPLPGATTTTNAECFRYRPDSSQTASTGIVYITASGKRLSNPGSSCASPGVVRTVTLGLRRQGFLDYLWLTDYEITDPVLAGSNASACTFHQWEWNAGANQYGPSNDSNDNCSPVSWTNLSTLHGPVHSNDGLYVCGNPTFDGSVDTYYNSAATTGAGHTPKFAGPTLVTNTCTGNGSPALAPNFDSGDPHSGSLLGFPPANTTIRSQADGVLGGTGCLYTGPTTITLLATGKMTVTSPKTLSTNAGCGPGTAGTQLSLPANGVIYVQNVPSGTDPNHSTCTGSSCIGDVNVSGTLNGQLTIASQDDIDITGDLVYHQYPTGTDVLGLVADNDVAVVHAADTDVTAPRTIDAAIMSLNHSFYVQNWDDCFRAHTNDNCAQSVYNLNVNGVIAQKFRGPVGTFSTSTGGLVTGYNKNYSYDSRLKYLSPPFFLNPTQSAWQRISYAEIPPKQVP